MRFRWAQLFFPCSGRWPAQDGEEEPLAGPLDAMFPSSGTRWDLAWGQGTAEEIITGLTCVRNTKPWEDLLDGEGVPAGPTPAWVDAGAGGMLQMGSFRGQPGCRPHGVGPGWDARAGSSPGDAALGPAGDAELTVSRHRTCSPRTASPVWPLAPGQRHGPVRPSCRAVSVST